MSEDLDINSFIKREEALIIRILTHIDEYCELVGNMELTKEKDKESVKRAKRIVRGAIAHICRVYGVKYDPALGINDNGRPQTEIP